MDPRIVKLLVLLSNETLVGVSEVQRVLVEQLEATEGEERMPLLQGLGRAQATGDLVEDALKALKDELVAPQTEQIGATDEPG